MREGAPLDPIPIEEIRAARERISGVVVRAPLVRLNVDGAPAEIHLKLENLQPIGSFKLRGARNAMLQEDPRNLAAGVVTASAGNMAQGVAWNARRMGIPCSVIVPETAPRTKVEAVARMGGRILEVPFDAWWQAMIDRAYPGVPGLFIHPVSDPRVIAGNGTIGLEILEDLPDVDAVVVPYGGGGLSCGIATAILDARPQAKVFAAEVSTAAPLAASLRAGRPRKVDVAPSFVDGIGGKGLLPEMWPLTRRLLAGSIVATPEEIAGAVRVLVERNRVIAEGAGAASVAAALSGRAGTGKVVCVVSGGNIDRAALLEILAGRVPCSSQSRTPESSA
jgi:threonine dehydratase